MVCLALFRNISGSLLSYITWIAMYRPAIPHVIMFIVHDMVVVHVVSLSRYWKSATSLADVTGVVMDTTALPKSRQLANMMESANYLRYIFR